MREILFRGFHECADGTEQIQLDGNMIKGRWIEGYFYASNLSGCFILQTKTVTKKIANGINIGDKLVPYNIIPETVCQYTGLKDKNGRKIFEGDKLKAKAYWAEAIGATTETIECLGGELYSRVSEKGNTVWTVEYANWNSFIGFRVYGVDRRWSAPLTYNKLYNGYCEIIGNIHDKE